MKKTLLFAVICGCLWAADRPYDDLMREVGAVCGSLKKNLDAKNDAAAADDAKKLQSLFKQTHAFWKAKNTTSAMEQAMAGGKASGAVAKAAAAGKNEEAQAAFKNVLGSCKGCHDGHREKGADGKWKIKGS